MDYKITVGCIYNRIFEYQKMIKSIVNMEKRLDFHQIEFIGVYNPKNRRFDSALGVKKDV